MGTACVSLSLSSRVASFPLDLPHAGYGGAFLVCPMLLGWVTLRTWTLGPCCLALPVLPDPGHSPPPCRLGLDGMKMQVRAVGPKLRPCHRPHLGFVHIPSLSSPHGLLAQGPVSEGCCWALLGGCHLAGMLTGTRDGGRTKGWQPPSVSGLYTEVTQPQLRGDEGHGGFLALADCCWMLILELAHGVWLVGSGQSEESPCPPLPPGAEPLRHAPCGRAVCAVC